MPEHTTEPPDRPVPAAAPAHQASRRFRAELFRSPGRAERIRRGVVRSGRTAPSPKGRSPTSASPDGDTIVWPDAPALLGISMQVLERELRRPRPVGASIGERRRHRGRSMEPSSSNARGIAPVGRIDEPWCRRARRSCRRSCGCSTRPRGIRSESRRVNRRTSMAARNRP